MDFYDTADALVDSRVLVIRACVPSRSFAVEDLEDIRIVRCATDPLRSITAHAASVTIMVALAASPATRRPLAFLAGTAVIVVAFVALGAVRTLRPRLYELRASYAGMQIVLLTSRQRSALVEVVDALTRAHELRLREIRQSFGSGRSPGTAA